MKTRIGGDAHRTAAKELRAAGVILLLLAATSAAPAVGDSPTAFQPLGPYLLEIDGVEDATARVLASREGILVLSSELPSPVLIDPWAQEARAVDVAKIRQGSDGSISLMPEPTVGSAFPASREAGGFVFSFAFSIDGRSVAIRPKPPLEGRVSAEQLYEYDPSFKTMTPDYTPMEKTVAYLRSCPGDVRVKVFFGSWSRDSNRAVSRMLKLVERVGESNLSAEYHALPRGYEDQEEAKRYGIRAVPTGIVYKDGAEVGRIDSELVWTIPELAIASKVSAGNPSSEN